MTLMTMTMKVVDSCLSDDRNSLVDVDTSHSCYVNAKKTHSSNMPKQQLTTNNERKVAGASLHIAPNHIANHVELVSSSSLDNDHDVKEINAKKMKDCDSSHRNVVDDELILSHDDFFMLIVC